MDNFAQRLYKSPFQHAYQLSQKEHYGVANGKMLQREAREHTKDGEAAELSRETCGKDKGGKAHKGGIDDILHGGECLIMGKDHPDGAEKVIEQSQSDAQQDREQVYLSFLLEGKGHFAHGTDPLSEQLSQKGRLSGSVLIAVDEGGYFTLDGKLAAFK